MSRIRNITFIIPVSAPVGGMPNLVADLARWPLKRANVVAAMTSLARIESATATTLCKRVEIPAAPVSTSLIVQVHNARTHG
jgi:hypothetical protein